VTAGNSLAQGETGEGFEPDGPFLWGVRRLRNCLNFVVDNPYESVLIFSADQNESFQMATMRQMTHSEWPESNSIESLEA
jgi:hypothetical protein